MFSFSWRKLIKNIYDKLSIFSINIYDPKIETIQRYNAVRPLLQQPFSYRGLHNVLLIQKQILGGQKLFLRWSSRKTPVSHLPAPASWYHVRSLDRVRCPAACNEIKYVILLLGNERPTEWYWLRKRGEWGMMGNISFPPLSVIISFMSLLFSD